MARFLPKKKKKGGKLWSMFVGGIKKMHLERRSISSVPDIRIENNPRHQLGYETSRNQIANEVHFLGLICKIYM